MPDPNILFGNEATKHLAALVRYWMQNYLLKTQWQYSMVACESDFNLGHTKFERVVLGKKRGGGHEYGKKRKLHPDEQPTGALKPKKKRENPVDKGQVKTGIGCKYCDKVCLNEETLSIHINNEHADRQSMFQCAFCGLRINDFRLYNKLSLVEVKSGVNLLLRHPSQLSSVQNSTQEILYDRTLLSRSAKRVKFDAVSVADLPELVPDLPQAVVACEPEVLQDSGEIMFEPFYFQM